MPFDAVDAKLAIPACQRAQAAIPTDMRMQFNLGRALQAGGELVQARQAYQVAADAGLAIAKVNLGSMLEAGEGGPADPRTAMALFEQAAVQGFPHGQFVLADRLMAGRHGPADLTRASSLLESASAAGHLDAARAAIKLIHDRPITNPGDLEQVALHLRRLSDTGDAESSEKLGSLLNEGLISPSAPDEERLRSRSAFEAGRPRAGLLYGGIVISEKPDDPPTKQAAARIFAQSLDIARKAAVHSPFASLELQKSLVQALLRTGFGPPTEIINPQDWNQILDDFGAKDDTSVIFRLRCGDKPETQLISAWSWSRPLPQIDYEMTRLEQSRGCVFPKGLRLAARDLYRSAKASEIHWPYIFRLLEPDPTAWIASANSLFAKAAVDALATLNPSASTQREALVSAVLNATDRWQQQLGDNMPSDATGTDKVIRNALSTRRVFGVACMAQELEAARDPHSVYLAFLATSIKGYAAFVEARRPEDIVRTATEFMTNLGLQSVRLRCIYPRLPDSAQTVLDRSRTERNPYRRTEDCTKMIRTIMEARRKQGIIEMVTEEGCFLMAVEAKTEQQFQAALAALPKNRSNGFHTIPGPFVRATAWCGEAQRTYRTQLDAVAKASEEAPKTNAAQCPLILSYFETIEAGEKALSVYCHAQDATTFRADLRRWRQNVQPTLKLCRGNAR